MAQYMLNEVLYQSAFRISRSALYGLTNTIKIPDVIGLTQAVATSTFLTSTLIASVVTAASSTVGAGLVIDQVPASDLYVNRGSTVSIIVSTGSGNPQGDFNALQDLLDPGENFHGVWITAQKDCPPVTSYYCQPILIYPGRAKWVDVTSSWTNQQKADHIRDVLKVPI